VKKSETAFEILKYKAYQNWASYKTKIFEAIDIQASKFRSQYIIMVGTETILNILRKPLRCFSTSLCDNVAEIFGVKKDGILER
jgi:hypothetical protein